MKHIGHYGYAELMEPEDGFANLHTTREIIDSYPEYKGLQIHITEFNTSYIPNCPIHDTNQNAAYIAHQLSRLGDDNESYSYWTFVYYKKLKTMAGKCVYKDDNCVIMHMENGEYRGIVWNMTLKRKNDKKELTYVFEALDQQYCLLTQRVDEDTTNPLKVWHDIGEPANLTKEQKKLLRAAAQPSITTERMNGKQEQIEITFALNENAVVYFELKQVSVSSDRGYSYERVMQK